VAALLALASSLMWGTSDFLGGVTARRLRPAVVVGWSQAVGLLAVTAAALATGALGGPAGWVPWSVLAGLSGAGGLVAFYRALSIGTMGVVSPIAALGAVVPVLAAVLGGETPSGAQVTGMVLGIAGAVVASGPELSGANRGSGRAWSVVLAALAGVLFGVAIVGIQRGARFDPLLTMVGMRLTSVTMFLLAAIVLRTAGGVGRAQLPVLVVVGVVDVAANLSLGYATTFGLASVVAVLGALYPVVTVLLGAVFLHERLRPVQVFGVALALGGVALLAAAS
jgi:drug/metabolite transporter (DMT)-like permease